MNLCYRHECITAGAHTHCEKCDVALPPTFAAASHVCPVRANPIIGSSDSWPLCERCKQYNRYPSAKECDGCHELICRLDWFLSNAEGRRIVREALAKAETVDAGNFILNGGCGGGGFCDKTTFGPPNDRNLVRCCRHAPDHSGPCEPALTVFVSVKGA